MRWRALAAAEPLGQLAQQGVAGRAVALDAEAGDGVGQALNSSGQRRLAHVQRGHELGSRLRPSSERALDVPRWIRGGKTLPGGHLNSL